MIIVDEILVTRPGIKIGTMLVAVSGRTCISTSGGQHAGEALWNVRGWWAFFFLWDHHTCMQEFVAFAGTMERERERQTLSSRIYL